MEKLSEIKIVLKDKTIISLRNSDEAKFIDGLYKVVKYDEYCYAVPIENINYVSYVTEYGEN